MSHSHHSHSHASKNLKIAFFLNLVFTLFEILGGLYVNSIAIISDAVHDLGDSLSLGTSWYLQEKSNKEADEHFSFGYMRFSLLGALISSLVLIAGSIYVINEAINRILHPEPSDALGMMIFAIIGVAVNGYAAWKLSSGKSLNERVISWHLIEDVLGWSAILIVSIVLQFVENQYLDPALSLLITIYILWNVIKRLKETLFIFLQGSPKDITINDIEQELLSIKNIQSLHHTHTWSLDGEHHVFTTHIKLETISNLSELLSIKEQLNKIINKYPFEHHTIEIELDDEDCRLEKGE